MVFVSKILKGLKERPLSEVGQYGIILARNALGLPNPIRNADRATLEQVILPAYARHPDIKAVLLVGCDWYTKHYEQSFAGRTVARFDPMKFDALSGLRCA